MNAVAAAFNQEKALVWGLLRDCTTSPINHLTALAENVAHWNIASREVTRPMGPWRDTEKCSVKSNNDPSSIVHIFRTGYNSQ